MIKQDTDERTFNALLVFILILVVWHFSRASKKKKTFGDEVEDMLFDKNISAETLEKQIVKEYGIEVEVEQQADEESRWRDLSAGNFLKGYSESEPDYTEADVKEPNPEYKKWKKAK